MLITIGELENRKTCEFFERLDAILWHRLASASSLLLDTSLLSTAEDEPMSDDGSEGEIGN